MNSLSVELRTNPGHAKPFEQEMLRALHFGLMLHWRVQEGIRTREVVTYEPLRTDENEPTELSGATIDRTRMREERGEGTALDRQLIRSSIFRIAIDPANPLGKRTMQQVLLVVKARAGHALPQPLGLKLHFGALLEHSISCTGQGPAPQRLWVAEGWSAAPVAVAYHGDIPEFVKAFETSLNATSTAPVAIQPTTAKPTTAPSVDPKTPGVPNTATTGAPATSLQAPTGQAQPDPVRAAESPRQATSPPFKVTAPPRQTNATAAWSAPALLWRASWRFRRFSRIEAIVIFAAFVAASMSLTSLGNRDLQPTALDLSVVGALGLVFLGLLKLGGRALRVATLHDLNLLVREEQMHYREPIEPKQLSVKYPDRVIGPEPTDVIRAWFKDNKITLQTPVKCEGMNEWRPLGLVVGALDGGPLNAQRLRRLAATLDGQEYPTKRPALRQTSASGPMLQPAGAPFLHSTRALLFWSLLLAVPAIMAVAEKPVLSLRMQDQATAQTLVTNSKLVSSVAVRPAAAHQSPHVRAPASSPASGSTAQTPRVAKASPPRTAFDASRPSSKQQATVHDDGDRRFEEQQQQLKETSERLRALSGIPEVVPNSGAVPSESNPQPPAYPQHPPAYSQPPSPPAPQPTQQQSGTDEVKAKILRGWQIDTQSPPQDVPAKP